MSQNGNPDFSSVSGGVTSTEADAPAKPDFSNVQGGVSSTEASAGVEQTYTVVTGDSLSHIAKHFYGKPAWQKIYDANRDQLDDPDRIHPGQVLRIPAAD
jgi:nucleoid-associated protein YgaU